MSDKEPGVEGKALAEDDGKTRFRTDMEAGKGASVDLKNIPDSEQKDPKKKGPKKKGAKKKKAVSALDETRIGFLDDPGISLLKDKPSKVEQPPGNSQEEPTLLQLPAMDDKTELSDADALTRFVSLDEVVEDRTIINVNTQDEPDGDATILPAGDAPSTYVATADGMADGENLGNSEAGRLLKNRFVLEERIGSGGMGDVYKALDLRAQEAQERNPYIAIKILNESFARHRDAFISLQREASKTRGIPHENIMAVYDFDREGDTVFMSMELLDGEPLDDYLKKHPEGVPDEVAWKILDGICKGLTRAHGAGIVHSDFKPGNIYFTEDMTAKVFDFGIARAVSNPGEMEADGDRTIFDAGTLGALTPTYASYEMLTGQQPAKSDDVFAAALVVYELFTGRHPYNRTPADKAFQQGLEPEPISSLKGRHWRALKKALALKAEDRTKSIEEFYEGMISEEPPYLRYAAVATIVVVLIVGGFYSFFQDTMDAQLVSKQLLMKTNVERLENRLKNTTDGDFKSLTWHSDLKLELGSIQAVNTELMTEWGHPEDPMVKKYEDAVVNAYTKRIQNLWEMANRLGEGQMDVVRALEYLTEAESYLTIVKESYGASTDMLRMQEMSLNSSIQLRELQLDTLTKSQAAKDNALAREQADQERNQIYDTNIQALQGILRACKGDIPDADLDRVAGILSRLKSTYPKRYLADKPGISQAFAGCISNRIAVRNPKRARVVQARVSEMMPDAESVASLSIEDKDTCAARKLVGNGNRGRGWCVDKLVSGGTGPELVVIPSSGRKIPKIYAISRAEIRIGEYNSYCKKAGCPQMPGSNSLPVTNISLEQAKAYASWLSDQTGRTFRLPTLDEWYHAARTNKDQPLDDNINCTVSSRGVRLGDHLLNSLSGKPNSWGLFNFVGNAREWVLDNDKVFAMGGAHTNLKSECTLAAKIAHSGKADAVTGFRVLRQI